MRPQGAALQPGLTWSLDTRAAALVAAAVAAAIAMEAAWIARGSGAPPGGYALMALLVLLGAAASHFPIRLTAAYKTTAASAAYFATILLFTPPVAIALVGVSVALGNGTLALRRNDEGRRRRGLYDGLFNVAQLMLAAGAGAVVLDTVRAQGSGLLMGAVDAVAVPLAAGAMHLTTTCLVALVSGLQSRRRPADLWLTAQRLDIASEAALYLIGFITAVVTASHPWAPAVMVVPAAVVYMSTKRAVQLNEQTVAAVEALADMVDRRDRSTADHSRRVAANVAVIARAMGLGAEEVADITLAARVHDLGKLGLPDSVLMKPGRLTDAEFELMKLHPKVGYEILGRLPQYRRGREIVLSHHERVDGRGYPRGVRADRIPIGAQIVAVADALDAMTSDRRYRPALPLHQAMTELRLGRGTQWSSAVVDAVDGLIKAEPERLSFGVIALPSASA